MNSSQTKKKQKTRSFVSDMSAASPQRARGKEMITEGRMDRQLSVRPTVVKGKDATTLLGLFQISSASTSWNAASFYEGSTCTSWVFHWKCLFLSPMDKTCVDNKVFRSKHWKILPCKTQKKRTFLFMVHFLSTDKNVHKQSCCLQSSSINT